MELDVWTGAWGLASFDAISLQFVALAKISGAQIRVNETNNPFKTPHGYLPIFKHGKHVLTDFQDVVSHLKKKNFCPDVNLTTKQLAETVAYEYLLHEKLEPALKYTWWMDSKNYAEVTRPCYSKVLPFPLNFYYPRRYRNECWNTFQDLNPLVDLFEYDIKHEIFKEAKKCLTNVSNRLGNSDFFFGKYPCAIDAFLYGYLAPLMKVQFPSPNPVQNHFNACPNLVKFVSRFTLRYFSSQLREYESKKQAESEATKKTDLILPNKTRNKILAGICATIAMLAYSFLMGLFKLGNASVVEDNFERRKQDEDGGEDSP